MLHMNSVYISNVRKQQYVLLLITLKGKKEISS